MNHLIKIKILVTLAALYVGCASADNTTSYEDKATAIEALRLYEQRPEIQSQLTAPQQARTEDIPFVCDEGGEYNCPTQQLVYKMQNEERPVWIANGKFKVTIHFKNDNNFPIKYVERKQFKDVPEDDAEKVRDQIFEHYFGADYASYEPELVNVYYNYVGIAILVASSNELVPLLDDSRVRNIGHMGNIEEIEEGY